VNPADVSSADGDPDDEPSAVYASRFASSFPMLTIVEADPGATMTFVAGGALKPIGGHILSHASATRMFLRKGALPSCFASRTPADRVFS
jgi:hypothetical protein